jgi:hypothetical protein
MKYSELNAIKIRNEIAIKTTIRKTRDPRIVQSFKDERYKSCLLN